jgi:hypothetical protein
MRPVIDRKAGWLAAFMVGLTCAVIAGWVAAGHYLLNQVILGR